MIFLNSDEYTPLNIHKVYTLVSKRFNNLNLEINIMSDQVEITDDNVNMNIGIYTNTTEGKGYVYNWNLPISARFLRDMSYDISTRIVETAKDGTAFCLERFMRDYFIFSKFDEEEGMFRFESIQVSQNGKSILNKFPNQVIELLDMQDPTLHHWITITRREFKKIAEDSIEIAKECNRYYYLILHVISDALNPPKPKKKKKVKSDD